MTKYNSYSMQMQNRIKIMLIFVTNFDRRCLMMRENNLQGSDLQRGNREVDVTVLVGNGICPVTEFTSNVIECKPPADWPNKGNRSDLCKGNERAIQVR